jgi:hypothetical protein
MSADKRITASGIRDGMDRQRRRMEAHDQRLREKILWPILDRLISSLSAERLDGISFEPRTVCYAEETPAQKAARESYMDSLARKPRF